MFTGIIEEIGKISRIEPISGGLRLKISTSSIHNDVAVHDSVCVNGVCLTAVKVDRDGFWTEAVGATIDKTTFSNITLSKPVNLELSMKLNDRLGGHLVQGHVNGIGTVNEITKLGENYFVKIDVPGSLQKYLIDEGSIAVDGISLTIAELNGSTVGLSIIPFTWENTNLKFKKAEDTVNIETDVLAKYVEKLFPHKDYSEENNITENWLKEQGY